MLPSKKYSKAHIFLFLICFNTINLFSQNGSSPFSKNLNPQGERNILDDRSQWKEIEQERKIFSSTFLTPDGRTIIYYSKAPVNYYKGNGMLVPIYPIPTFSSKGLSATEQPNTVSVLNNGTVEINTGNGASISYSGNIKINGKTTSTSEIKLEGANAIMQNILPGVDKTFEFRFNSLKYNYVINHPLLTTASDLIIEEEIGLPQNAKVSPDPNYGQQDARGWLGALTINSENGTELGTIRAALCYDANKNYITAAYKMESENGKQKIKIIVPASWINDPGRVYPITIDPLVTGPTSTWTGGFIPSCIAPASGSDSILVTIPAKVTVTALFVSGSFYANPFSTAIMNDGAMFFSTSCNTSTSFTTTGTAGITAGTAYLTAYDLKSPLLCCKPQSCIAQTFYLSMHVQRTAPGAGCGTSYIYHDPFGGYPFSAYVEGHTVEGYGPLWNVSPSTICSNVCNINGVVYIKYGVPPFTITHPWMTGSVIAGTPAGCSTATIIKTLNLTIPTCPWTCDTISVLSVPPPTVSDACGNILTGTAAKIIHIKETPEVTASPNPLTNCSGDPFTITLTPCLGTSTVYWNGNGTSGTGTNISQTVVNTNSTVTSTTYQVSAVNNTCNSDTITVTVNTDPLPIASFTASPQPVIINNPLVFTDNTSAVGGITNTWLWDFGDGSFDSNQNPSHVYTIPGAYHVCLDIQTSDGCLDTICRDINVIPAALVLPNVITPNGDNLNDFLYFKYLEFFGTNNLKVYDRWGKIVYQKENYTNDWSAANVKDGTYYYVLAVEKGETFPGYVQIIHK